ncbi:hypothetical protein D9611_015004 [Ephemerocybe angulata]|uniref:Myb-like domain-containing protein n=1 Tax=Ephemerocybe angulata TaxID=980116 RepID=A0A8H5ER59_9AGAR|nr:hypothetical protein D9611_015004 [Tulosesus angulatus]
MPTTRSQATTKGTNALATPAGSRQPAPRRTTSNKRQGSGPKGKQRGTGRGSKAAAKHVEKPAAETLPDASPVPSPGHSDSEDQGEMSVPEPQCSKEPRNQARNASSPAWLPWQDRLLAQEVFKHQPFDNERGKATREAWDRLAQALATDSAKSGEGSKVNRTGDACKARFLKLLEYHRKEETVSKQKTGTNEEVTSHTQVMTELMQLWDDHAAAKQEKTAKEKNKVSQETKASLELRDAAMKGRVPRQTLTDIAELPGASVREKQGQRAEKRKSPSTGSNKENEGSFSRPSKRRRSELTRVVESRMEADKKLLEDAIKVEERRQEELKAMHSSLGQGLDKVSQSLAALADFQRVQAEREVEQRAREAEQRARDSERQMQLQLSIIELMKRTV